MSNGKLPEIPRGLVATELLFTFIAGIAAMAEEWGLFAAFTLWVVIVPLWVIAISCVVNAFSDTGDT